MYGEGDTERYIHGERDRERKGKRKREGGEIKNSIEMAKKSSKRMKQVPESESEEEVVELVNHVSQYVNTLYLYSKYML